MPLINESKPFLPMTLLALDGWLAALFYTVSILFGSFNAELIFKTIHFSISIDFVYKLLNVKNVQLNDKTVLFQTIQFSISAQFSYVWPTDRILSAATTPDQIGPGSDGSEGVLRIPQSSSITATSPWVCLVSHQDTRWWGGVLPLCREAVSIFYSPSRLDKLLTLEKAKTMLAK